MLIVQLYYPQSALFVNFDEFNDIRYIAIYHIANVVKSIEGDTFVFSQGI